MIGRCYVGKGQPSGNTASWEGGSAPGEAGQEEKMEQKVRGRSKRRGQVYIDVADVLRRQAKAVKAASR